MNETQALQMIKDANPIPDAGVYAAEVLSDRRAGATVFLTATQERTMTQTLDTQTPKTPTPKRPWWQPAMAAAAVVVVAIAAAAFVFASDDDATTPSEEPVPTTVAQLVDEQAGRFSTGTDAAQAWIDNANNPDWDTYVELFTQQERSDVATVTATDYHHGTFELGSSIEEAQQHYELMTIVGAEYTLVENCTEIGPGGYSCPVSVSGGLVDALTGGELVIDLRIVIGTDGYVQSVASSLEEGAAAEVAFLDWLSKNRGPLYDEWVWQLNGDVPLERPLSDIVSEYRAAQQDYLDQQ